jgi:CheY-like chemotaxis protein
MRQFRLLSVSAALTRRIRGPVMRKVLVIDCNRQVRATARAALQLAGFDVAEADDGDAGLRLYRQAPCDLILCDLLMSRAGGLETIRELRASGGRVPVIALSAGLPGSRADRRHVARSLGAAGMLPKPFTVWQLLDAVRGTLPQTAAPAP